MNISNSAVSSVSLNVAASAAPPALNRDPPAVGSLNTTALGEAPDVVNP